LEDDAIVIVIIETGCEAVDVIEWLRVGSNDNARLSSIKNGKVLDELSDF
jgi:hypothetical protein